MHAHFNQQDHNGIDDWSFKIIDSAIDITSVRRKESYWQHRLNTFIPNGLNERKVSLEYGQGMKLGHYSCILELFLSCFLLQSY